MRQTPHHNTHTLSSAILPPHFFNTLRQRFPGRGEVQLLGALLEDAVYCFQKYLLGYRARERRLFREAEAWLLGDSPPPARPARRDAGFSFEDVCTALKIDARLVRGNVRRWRERCLTELAGHTAPSPNNPASPSQRSTRPLQPSPAPF